jgi:hypothetical protein
VAVYNDYTVEFYDDVAAAWVDVPNVLSLRCSLGRNQASDQWAVSSGLARARFTGAFDIADVKVGAEVRWFAPGRTGTPTYSGYVKDARVIWGIPYDSVSGVGNGDEIEIEFEGMLGRLGRSFEGLEFPEHVSFIWSNTNVPDVPFSLMRAADGEYNEQVIQIRMSDTVQGRICDGVYLNSRSDAYLAASTDTPYAPITFSDTDNDATHRVYSELEFSGLANDYFTFVTVAPDQFPPVTASAGVSQIRNYDLITWSASTAAAQYLADYLLVKFGNPAAAPSRIRARTSGQHTQNLDTLGVSGLELGYLVKYRVAIEFRGQTYYAQIEGIDVEADLSETTYTYYLSPDDGVGWFTLDSATLGVLDEDRLGFI